MKGKNIRLACIWILIISISFLILIILSTISGCGGKGSGGDSSSSLSISDDNPSNDNSLILTWEAPTTNVDGTPLTDLAGYKIYYGVSSGEYTKVIIITDNITTYTIENLSSGTYYFAVTAYDTAGNESAYSNEVSKTIY